MPNTLDIDDEWGPVDIVLSLEQAFAIKLEDAEVKDLYQVGPLYDLLLKKVPRDGAGGKCASAMAFYRLRRALEVPVKLTPKSGIGFLEQQRLKRNWKSLQETSGLTLPPLAMRYQKSLTTLGLIALAGLPALAVGFVLVLLSIPLGHTVVLAGAMLPLGMIALLVALAAIDPRKLPDDTRTLGALATQAAMRNYGLLARAGAPLSDKIIWDVMITALADHSDLPPDQITRETWFLRSSMKKAA